MQLNSPDGPPRQDGRAGPSAPVGRVAPRPGPSGDTFPTLAEAGIRLRRETPGEHRCPCPECAGAKARRGDDAM